MKRDIPTYQIKMSVPSVDIWYMKKCAFPVQIQDPEYIFCLFIHSAEIEKAKQSTT